MKVIPQYKVIIRYNYDRIKHSTEKINAKRQDIGHKQIERSIQFKN